MKHVAISVIIIMRIGFYFSYLVNPFDSVSLALMICLIKSNSRRLAFESKNKSIQQVRKGEKIMYFQNFQRFLMIETDVYRRHYKSIIMKYYKTTMRQSNKN